MAPIEDTSAVWSAMRAGLNDAEHELGYDSMILFHPTNSWVVKPETYNFTPLGGRDSTKNYENIVEMRDKFTGLVFDLENHYEGAHVGFDADQPIWNASHIRTGLYHAVYNGATGFTYGAHSVWQLYEPKSDLVDERLYYDPMLNLNASGSWRDGFTSKLEPTREILASPSNYTGKSVNMHEGTRYISMLASMARDRYYVYTGHGDSFSLQLDNGSGSRSGSATWFSPRDGQYYASFTVSVAGVPPPEWISPHRRPAASCWSFRSLAERFSKTVSGTWDLVKPYERYCCENC
ncbi:hypothetical protein PC120_g2760 [Phytophthora cactorum]|nr:hypothetical protein PC120_g2760 [Phytophthora cactorum]